MTKITELTVFFYCCLGYFIFHLLLSDILILFKFFTRKENDDLSYIESKTITIIFNKLCDIVLKCVMGYYYIFQLCWTSSVDCLKQVMLAYLAFLEKLVEKMLEYPTCVWTSSSVVLIVITISVTIIQLFGNN